MQLTLAAMGLPVDQRNDCWETPPKKYKELDDEFHFSIDVAASKENAKCPIFYTEEDDALSINWVEDAKRLGVRPVFFMNPPYSQTAYWMEYALKQSRLGATVVCLVPNSTESGWFHDFALQGVVRFLRGRIQFWLNGKKPKQSSNPKGSIIVIFRPKVNAECQF